VTLPRKVSRVGHPKEAVSVQACFTSGRVCTGARSVNVAELTGLVFPNISVEATVAMHPDVTVHLMMGV
jgi:hypothetical protein